MSYIAKTTTTTVTDDRYTKDRSKSSNKYFFIITTTASIVVCGTCCIYRLVIWRARKRSRKIVKQIVDSIREDGPLIDYNEAAIRDPIVITSTKRASKWMTLSKHQIIHPMIGQVGGLGRNRKPMLTLLPDYICKPLLLDHRGLREIAFYEAIRTITQSQAQHVGYNYSKFLTGRETLQPQHSVNFEISAASTIKNGSSSSSSYQSLFSNIRQTITSLISPMMESIDTISMALALSKYIQDSYVLQSEATLLHAWQNIQYEIDLLRQLHKFTPPYYGIIFIPTPTPLAVVPVTTTSTANSNEQNNNEQSLLVHNQNLPQLSSPLHGTTLTTTIPPSVPDPVASSNHWWDQLQDSHLLLQDLTINYSKPCVMDLKMGIQTYEPDSSLEKRTREHGKYPDQMQFGFRIVGMRFYDPSHCDADAKGYRYYEKSFGRSLKTRDELIEAFKLFFSAGCVQQSHSDHFGNDTNSEHHTHNMNGDYNTPSKQSSPTASSSRIRRRTISNILVQLRPIRRWFEENKALRFYASSLLIIYEGDVVTNPDMTTVKMIDFGRVRRERGGDQGYITGLSTIKNIFADLLNDDEHMIDVNNNKTV